jgi:23S rRNA G2445 N2-methylase RlmL
MIRFERKDVKDAAPPAGPPGVVICNPPYGERIGDEKEWIGLYRKIGEVFGGRWPGWRLFVFTSNDFLAKKVGLPVKGRVPFFNGKIPCHLWEFGT